jgi:glucosamine kinase
MVLRILPSLWSHARMSSPTPALGMGLGRGLGLGLDVGGTEARWALVTAAGQVLAQGRCAGFDATLSGVSATVQAVAASGLQPTCMAVGLTGWDATAADLRGPLAQAFGVRANQVRVMSDIELVCRAHFAPGQGIALVAGTGSIAAHLDAQGHLQRAGGRGVLLDDAGGGHWIAREALRAVWRSEDEAPGAAAHSVLAHSLFAALGGNDWATTRAFMATASRGQVGALASAVAQAARQGDAQALAIFEQAGCELARLLHAMAQRVGTHTVALCGRVFELHPHIEAALCRACPGVVMQRSALNLAVAAAGLASPA